MPNPTSLPKDLKAQAQRILNFQRLHPHLDCVVQMYVGVDWRLIDLKTLKRYTPDSYEKEFGEYPVLPHPEIFYSDEAIAARQAARRQKPKGFAQIPKTKPAKRRRHGG